MMRWSHLLLSCWCFDASATIAIGRKAVYHQMSFLFFGWAVALLVDGEPRRDTADYLCVVVAAVTSGETLVAGLIEAASRSRGGVSVTHQDMR